MDGIIKEGYRTNHNGYTITTEYVKSSESVGNRIYDAIALKNGVQVEHYNSIFNFEDAIEQLKALLDFNLSVD